MLDATTPLKISLAGIDSLAGQPTVDLVGGPVCRYLERERELSWVALGEMAPQQILDLPNMGVKRLDLLVTNVVGLLGQAPNRIGSIDGPASDDRVIDDQTTFALRSIASWAVGTGRATNLLDAVILAAEDDHVDAPHHALAALRDVRLDDLVIDEVVRDFDPVAIAQGIIDSFDARQSDVLERVLDLDNSAPTLQKVGEKHQVSRQRIEQIERKVRQKLQESVIRSDHLSLIAAARELAIRIGTAVPLVELKRDFAQFPPDLVDRLLLHLAGPYQLRDDWVVDESMRRIDDGVMAAFVSVAPAGWVPVDVFHDALTELGVLPQHHAAALGATPKLRMIDDTVVDWQGSMVTKAKRILALRGEAMTSEQLAEAIGAESPRSFSNQLSSLGLSRVGPGRYALSEWDMSEYQGIVPAMVERLEAAGGPLDIVELGQAIADEYGASPASITILSGTHPAFISDAGRVRLRPDDSPYVPTQQLADTPRCYRVDGSWTWRFPVNRDTLRGSGRQIPEALATHLGLLPLQAGSLHTPFGDISMRWTQYPAIGSARTAARKLDAEDGDFIFLICRSASFVELNLLASDALSVDPGHRLRQLVGGPLHGDLIDVVADALDLPSTRSRGTAEVRASLVARKEHELVELLDKS